MNISNTNSTSELAYQKAQDLSKEVTHIYSEIKNLKTNVLENSESITTLQNSGGSDSPTTTDPTTFIPTHISQMGAKVYIGFHTGTDEDVIPPYNLKAETAGLYKFTVSFQISNPNLTSLLTLTTAKFFVNNNLEDLQIMGPVTDKRVNSQVYTFSFFASLNAGNNTFHTTLKMDDNGSAYTICHFLLRIEGVSKVKIFNETTFCSVSTNGTEIVLTHTTIPYRYQITFADITELENYNYRNFTSVMGEQYSAILTIADAYMPQLDPETNTYKKTEYFFEKGASASNILSGTLNGTVVAASCSMIRKKKYPVFAVEYANTQQGIVAGCFSKENDYAYLCHILNDSQKTNMRTGGQTFPEFVYMDSVKTIDSSCLPYPFVFGLTENGDCYYITFTFNGKSVYVDAVNSKKIAENIHLSHSYYINNKIYMFYSDNFYCRLKIYNLSNHIFTQVSDTLYAQAEQVLVISPTKQLHLKNGVFVVKTISIE